MPSTSVKGPTVVLTTGTPAPTWVDTVVVRTYCSKDPDSLVQVVVTKLLPAFGAAGVHDATETSLSTVVPHVISVQELPEFATCGLQAATGVGPVVTATGQVTVVQLLPAEAPAGVHEADPVDVTMTGQVISVQLLPAAAVCGVHDETGTFAAPLLTQLVVTQELPEVPGAGEQDETGTSVVVSVLQVVVRWPLPAEGTTGTHEATGTLVVFPLLQLMVSQLLPALPTCGVQEGTPVAPVMSVGQVVVVQLLPTFGPLGTQVPDGAFSTLLEPQVVVVKLLPMNGTGSGVQEDTGTSVVVTDGAQLIVIQLLPALPTWGVHTATGTFSWSLFPQVMVAQLLPALPVCGVHEMTG